MSWTLICPHCRHGLTLGLIAINGKQEAPAQNKMSASTGELETMLLQVHEDDLDAKAAQFVRDTRERYKKYKERIQWTEKQDDYLKAIVAGKCNKDNWE